MVLVLKRGLIERAGRSERAMRAAHAVGDRPRCSSEKDTTPSLVIVFVIFSKDVLSSHTKTKTIPNQEAEKEGDFKKTCFIYF